MCEDSGDSDREGFRTQLCSQYNPTPEVEYDFQDLLEAPGGRASKSDPRVIEQDDSSVSCHLVTVTSNLFNIYVLFLSLH